MAKTKALDPEQKARVIKMRKSGTPVSRIVEETGFTPGQVHNTIYYKPGAKAKKAKALAKQIKRRHSHPKQSKPARKLLGSPVSLGDIQSLAESGNLVTAYFGNTPVRISPQDLARVLAQGAA